MGGLWLLLLSLRCSSISACIGRSSTALDARRAKIKSELDEARKLREEAQALLAEFERKGREAEAEAAAIIDSAKAEAERLAGEAKTRMEKLVARRTKMAETKIAQAEAQALADVKSAAADAAVAAAERILAGSTKGQVAENLPWRAASKTSKANSTEPAPAARCFSRNRFFFCLIAYISTYFVCALQSRDLHNPQL